ncbi:hypothetical protein FOA52_014005 [Chlamydomonas sp. UWO 241]|nr:hypothetical protein FOA52_014005 [Chlamydomonas sp. UWO 241]
MQRLRACMGVHAWLEGGLTACCTSGLSTSSRKGEEEEGDQAGQHAARARWSQARRAGAGTQQQAAGTSAAEYLRRRTLDSDEFHNVRFERMRPAGGGGSDAGGGRGGGGGGGGGGRAQRQQPGEQHPGAGNRGGAGARGAAWFQARWGDAGLGLDLDNLDKMMAMRQRAQRAQQSGSGRGGGGAARGGGGGGDGDAWWDDGYGKASSAYSRVGGGHGAADDGAWWSGAAARGARGAARDARAHAWWEHSHGAAWGQHGGSAGGSGSGSGSGAGAWSYAWAGGSGGGGGSGAGRSATVLRCLGELGLGADAPLDSVTLKAAFHGMAKRFHPDVHADQAGKVNAEARFKAASDAYKQLAEHTAAKA